MQKVKKIPPLFAMAKFTFHIVEYFDGITIRDQTGLEVARKKYYNLRRLDEYSDLD